MTIFRIAVYGHPAPLPPHVVRHISPSPDGCWLWQAALSPDGYGWTSYKNRTYQAHRFVWQATYGPVPDGFVLDHLCRVRHCVNPAHLEPVTNRENLRRGNTPTGMTQCSQGHPLSNLRNQRRCLPCLAQYEESRREQKRLAERERRARIKAAAR